MALSDIIRSVSARYLVSDVGQGDVVVDLDRALVVHQQIHDVGDGRRHPATTLVVELAESFGSVGVGIGGGRVLDPVASLQQEGAQPPVLALIVLHVMTRLVGGQRVPLHHVVVHQTLGTEQREASRTTEHAADHVFGGLLQPMADSVLEELVPHHGTGADRVDTAAGGTQVPILLHQIDQ